MRRLVLALALVGCQRSERPKPAPDARVVATAVAADAAPTLPVALATVDAAAALPAPTRHLVVVTADGAVTVTADLATLGAATPLDGLAAAVAEPTPTCDGTEFGLGRFGTITDSRRQHAGLIGFVERGPVSCRMPLVVIDAAAPAALLVEVLRALGTAMIGVTTDGATARALAVRVQYTEGNTPAEPDPDELVVTVTHDGATPEPTARRVRIKLDGDVTAGAVIATIARALAAGATTISIGERIDRVEEVPPRRAAPTSVLGQPTVTGGADAVMVRRYLKRHGAQLAYCYEQALVATPALDGAVTAELDVGVDGKVTNAKASGLDAGMAACLVGVLGSIEFPAPPSASHVTLPMTFHPPEVTP